MRHLPRFAVGTIQPGAHRDPVVWSLLAALADASESPVPFHSSFDICVRDPAKAVLGSASRHLDSWAMSRSDAISALARAGGEQDIAIVEGTFDTANAQVGQAFLSAAPHSSLDRLCEWLDLPRIAIIDVRDLASRGINQRPPKIDGLLLDRVPNPYEAAYWQTTLEALWGTPILGWLDEAAPLRAQCASLAAGANPSAELCHALGQRLAPTLRLPRLRQLASRAMPLSFEPEAWLMNAQRQSFRIAVALDEHFHCYYPESLDLLEAAGAELRDFSPLRNEAIPSNVDVVYFGCGHVERDPEKLAANHCLKQSLRSFAAAGGRIYAEGSGLAYLCREIILPGDRAIAMTGLLPAAARLIDQPAPAEAAEITFGLSSWLAPASFSLRGYRHGEWQIEPCGPMLAYAAGANQPFDILGRGNIIGSRVLINLAANRHLSPVLRALRARFDFCSAGPRVAQHTAANNAFDTLADSLNTQRFPAAPASARVPVCPSALTPHGQHAVPA